MNYATFLRHKVKLVVQHARKGDLLDEDRRDLVPRYERTIAQLLKEKSSTSAWKDIEHDLNVMIRATVGPKERKLMKDELTKKFGATDIGSSDETIAKRVLKRGSIVGNEGQAVRDMLSDLPEAVFTDDEQKKLSAIYGKWEQGK